MSSRERGKSGALLFFGDMRLLFDSCSKPAGCGPARQSAQLGAKVWPVDDREAFVLRRHVLQLHRALRAKPFEVRPLSDILVLDAIDRLGGELTSASIADELHMQRTNVATYMTRLERDGLVDRIQNVNDGRRSSFTLSEVGRAVLERDRQLGDENLATAANTALSDDESKLLIEAGELMERLAMSILESSRESE